MHGSAAIRARSRRCVLSPPAFRDAEVVYHEPRSIDDSALYPLFSGEVDTLMRRLPPPSRHGAVPVGGCQGNLLRADDAWVHLL